MAKLTVYRGSECLILPFEGQPTVNALLAEAGLARSQPCGGGGRCGKCAVTVYGAVSAPDAREQKAGTRLACRARLLGDAVVRLPEADAFFQIEAAPTPQIKPLLPMAGAYGAAVDIGTTTVVTCLYDLKTGALLAKAAQKNPQDTVAADVMGRIAAAREGQQTQLQELIRGCICAQLKQCAEAAGLSCLPESLVITGNTTMLYLLTGRDTDCLSHVPFQADCLFDLELPFGQGTAYLPPCMSAFVGADITCALLASGLLEKEETALLCDIGTNGELALWSDKVLYVTSTAAGPAFEGAGISCGCGSIPGAIDALWVQEGRLQLHTFSDAPPVGLCGSGLLDALAAALTLGAMDETGTLEEDAFPLCPLVSLTQEDIRAAQLAKAAIAAGIDTLLTKAGLQPEDLRTLYIAGGFGSHLNMASAAAIGLIPPGLSDRVRILGNAALAGACQTLLQGSSRHSLRQIAAAARPINLGGDPLFNDLYIGHMLFPAP